MPGLVPSHRPSPTPRCSQTRLPVVGTHAAPLPRGQWQPRLGTGCSPAPSVRPAAWRRVVRDPPGRGAASQRARSMASPLGPSPRSLRGHPSPHVDVCSAGVSCKPGSTWGRQASMLACWTSPGPGGMSGCACPHGSHRLTQATRTWAAPRGRRSPSPTRRGAPYERAGRRVSMRPARGRLSRLREWIVSYSDGRVRHIMFYFPPSPVIGAAGGV